MNVSTCKLKNFLAFVISISLISLLCLCLFVRDERTQIDLQNFVTQTHKQFKTLQENFPYPKVIEKKLDVDSRILKLLGFFKENSSNFLNLTQKNHLPITVVTAISSQELSEQDDFLRSIDKYLSNSSIVLWDLNPSLPSSSLLSEESEFSSELRYLCNSSKCNLLKFNYEDYPDHVRDLSTRAYRPIIIQMMLERSGCVLWLDLDRRLLPFPKNTLYDFLTSAVRNEGILGWSAGHPTSTLTHPKMFSYFDSNVENYYFHRMIDPAQLLVCNTQFIHSQVMLSWVKCSLTKECISPFGSQSGGCRFDKKPLFRYSGCHAYDSSALNLVLGLSFSFHQPYISPIPISRALLATNQTTPSN